MDDHLKSTTKSPQIHMYFLGRFRVESGNEPIQLSTRKTESLLAYLVLNPESHAREKLAALFWGDSSDTDARNSLRNALAKLNKKLGHELLITDRQSIQVNPEYPLWVDAVELESQVSSLVAGSASTNEVNIELYQNDLLIDFYDDWIFLQREHFRSLFLDTLLELAQQMRSQSEYEKAIEYATKALAFDHTNERAHQHLMFCQMALGDRNAALKQYEECARILDEEFSVEPSTATIALYEWIKQTPSEAHPFEARITNLPIPLTSFIGRKREMSTIKQLLTSTRLITLTGSGGSGKTRLAIQVGMDVLDSFKDGGWWIDLSALTNKNLVAQSIAKSLGIQEAANLPPSETLANHLRSKHLLLIIDNCEHLIEASAQIIELLLKECPQLKILATSRESLNILGEHVWDVPLMGLPDPENLSLTDLLLDYEGIQLFTDRAKLVSTDFTLTEENASFVAQICFDLDGIPLAIELAAARIKHLSAEQIAVRLNDRFQLLRGGRTAIPRHQTLQAVMEWSYNLLTEKESVLFQRLAVFSGGWNLDAVEEVCSDENINKSEILDILSNLVDKSLVIKYGEREGKARYRMLETIRQYARTELKKSGNKSKIQKHHLDYFTGIVKSVNPHLGFFLSDQEMLSWMSILSPDLDNIRSALTLCKSDTQYSELGLEMASKLHWFWLLSNQLREGHGWIDNILDESKPISKPIHALGHLSAGFLSCWQGDFSSARPNLEKSSNLFDEIGDKSGIAFSLHGLGFAANGVGEPEKAGPLFEKCLKTARDIDDKWLIAIALHFIAISSSFQGAIELARTQFNECIDLFKNGYGNLQGIAFSEFHLGRISNIQGDYESAYTHHLEGMQLFRQMGDHRGIGYAMFGLARLAHTQEEPLRAARLIGIADSIREDLGALLEAPLQIEYDHVKSETQEALGMDAFHTAWLDGKNMNLEDAIQYALNPD